MIGLIDTYKNRDHYNRKNAKTCTSSLQPAASFYTTLSQFFFLFWIFVIYCQLTAPHQWYHHTAGWCSLQFQMFIQKAFSTSYNERVRCVTLRVCCWKILCLAGMSHKIPWCVRLISEVLNTQRSEVRKYFKDCTDRIILFIEQDI